MIQAGEAGCVRSSFLNPIVATDQDTIFLVSTLRIISLFVMPRRPKQVRLHRQTTSSLFYQRPHLSITPPQVPQLSAASPAASSAGLPLIYIQKRLWVFWYRAEHILQ